jgi:dipeptidyl aminopeptidase/acylaminoacyl peptidase
LTAVNDDLLRGIKLGNVEEFSYTSLDNLKIQGWIVKPPDFDPQKKYPMILSIHGGPAGMYDVGFSFEYQDHAANGYVVVYTNPRGSTGYGTDFGNAINYDYPGKDFTDLMKGVDEVISRGYIDSRNLFVYGCSGGGRAYFLGRRSHRPLCGGVGQLPGDRLAFVRGDRRRAAELLLALLQEPSVGGPRLSI